MTFAGKVASIVISGRTSQIRSQNAAGGHLRRLMIEQVF